MRKKFAAGKIRMAAKVCVFERDATESVWPGTGLMQCFVGGQDLLSLLRPMREQRTYVLPTGFLRQGAQVGSSAKSRTDELGSMPEGCACEIGLNPEGRANESGRLIEDRAREIGCVVEGRLGETGPMPERRNVLIKCAAMSAIGGKPRHST
jgi:hypothetical protein